MRRHPEQAARIALRARPVEQLTQGGSEWAEYVGTKEQAEFEAEHRIGDEVPILL
jgi:hypothetical protein